MYVILMIISLTLAEKARMLQNNANPRDSVVLFA